MKTEVIAFSGKMGSGKDYFSNLLKNKIDNLENVSFGFAVKEEVTNIVNDLIFNNMQKHEVAKKYNTEEQFLEELLQLYKEIEDKKEKFDGFKKNNTIRQMLQFWGTEVRRSQDENYWVNQTKKTIKEVNKKGKIAIITDCRFENEANMLLNDFNTILVRLTTSKEEQLRRLKKRDGVVPDESKLNHSSETALDNFKKFTLKLNTEMYFDSENLEFIMKKVEK